MILLWIKKWRKKEIKPEEEAGAESFSFQR